MKTKILTAAIASVMASSVAMAEGDSNAVSSALANGTVSGEVYGAYRSEDDDGVDSSDFDLDVLRIGYTTNVNDSTELGIEVEWALGDGPGENDQTIIRDLYVAKAINDNTTVTVGRFKQLADRNVAVEQSDALFTTLALEADALGLRRIDGVEIKHANASGLNGTLSVYKGGEDTSGGDTERNFGYAASLGWQGGADDLSFGVTAAAFQVDGDDSGAASTEDSGYSIILNAAMGPVVASLEYLDTTEESTGNEDVDVDGIVIQGAFNLGGASRSFDNYGVLQGPTVAKGDMGYEIGFAYSTGTEEENGFLDVDQDAMGIVLNAYCGPNTKWFLSYTDVETDNGVGADQEFDQIALGARLDF